MGEALQIYEGEVLQVGEQESDLRIQVDVQNLEFCHFYFSEGVAV